ncbi:MAG: hypothetical protein IJQ52_06375 [Bacteroidales bacterium]|nr:hypothetical protein [Bacteroidales bacterium]MBR0297825.1 hypothetical protein [Bacteroidales bacterium]
MKNKLVINDLGCRKGYETPSSRVLELKLARFVLLSVVPPEIKDEEEDWD